MINQIITPKEIAKQFGISEEMVLAWRSQGMPSIKIGKFILIRKISFLKWLENLEKGQNVQDAL